MTMHPVISTSVISVGHDPRTRTLRVQFRSGSTYDYCGVDPGFFDQMLLPNPWRRVGRLVKTRPYAKVA